MALYSLRFEIHRLLNTLDAYPDVLETIRIMTNPTDQALKKLAALVSAPQNTTGRAVAELRGPFKAAASALKSGTSTRQFFVDSQNLVEELEKFSETSIGLGQIAHDVARYIDRLAGLFERFVETGFQPDRVVMCWSEALEIVSRLETLTQTLKSIEQAYLDPTVERSDYDSLELFFPASLSSDVQFAAEELNRTLTSLTQLYEMWSRVLDRSAQSHPLILIRAEIGSRWIQVAGEQAVTRLMEIAAKITGRLLLQSTPLGKVTTAREELALSREWTTLIREMKREGYSDADLERVKSIDANAKRALAQKHADLLIGEGEFFVGTEEFQGLKPTKRIAQADRRKLLGYGDDGNGKFRRRTGSNGKWHFCSECRYWPAEDYEVSPTLPTRGEICDICSFKAQAGDCSSR